MYALILQVIKKDVQMNDGCPQNEYSRKCVPIVMLLIFRVILECKHLYFFESKSYGSIYIAASLEDECL